MFDVLFSAKAMPDILLIQPPIADFYHTAKRTIPYGLASIAATLMQEGFSVEILDAMATGKSRPHPLPGEMEYLSPYYGRADRSPFALFHRFRHYGYSLSYIGERVESSGAFLVGISSLFTAYWDMARAVAQTVKERLPGTTVVLGGHHPTTCFHEVMKEPAVDLVLRGEGETTMPKLAMALKMGRNMEKVPGLVFRRKEGTLHVSSPVVCENLDRLPIPAHALTNKKFYGRAGKQSITITASRGCPFSCSYCATGKKSWMGYRRRPVSAVLEELRAVTAGQNVGFIDFEDENLSMDQSWFLELMAGIGTIFGETPPELRAMNGLFPPSLSETVVAGMATAGFKTLNLSLGSTDSQQLKRFHRPDVRDAFDRALVYARRQKMAAVGYIIVGAPGQDPRSSVEDLLFLARRDALVGVSVFYPAPGSRDYDRCERLGLLPESFAAMRATALPIDHTTTRTASVTLLRLGRILNFMKSLVSQKIPMPMPAPPKCHMDPGLDRHLVGLKLLSYFLFDGRIRGVDHEGTVFTHVTSESLCREFIAGLQKGKLCGA